MTFTARSVSAALWLVATPLSSVTALLREGTPTRAAVGDWVSYELGGDDVRPTYVRLGVAGEARDPGGQPALWFDVELADHPSFNSPLLQLKLLASRAKGLQLGSISRAIVAFGYDEPRELSDEALQAMLQPEAGEPGTPPSVKWTLKDRPAMRLMTPAGSVRAHAKEVWVETTLWKRLWLSEDVPLLGVAQVELPPVKRRMELRGFGKGYASKIEMPKSGDSKIRVEGYHKSQP